ncbi:MAG: DinB family protein [Bacteroidota bacterium]
MINIEFNKVFSDSFDTFKALNNLSTTQASETSSGTPSSIWQILNHLTIWQDFQLKNLKGIASVDIQEANTWAEEKNVTEEKLLQERIALFHTQIEQIKMEVSQLSITDKDIEKKLKTIQDVSVHLSFHLGEIVLIRRQLGHYPKPSEMKAFLAND